MIPILYKKADTDYTHNGVGFLTDILTCDITEERNGAYECIFTYPTTGQHYAEIAEGDVIKAKPNDTSSLQLFRIYAHSKPLNGVVTFNAEHISYDANGIPLVSLVVKATTPQAAINKAISEGAFESNFSALSDISTLNSIKITEPCSLRAALGGQQGSVLDVWGGEYEFDNYVIKLHAHRGTDSGVTIEYGKNLTNVQQDRNITEVYTHLLPYAIYQEESDDGATQDDVIVTLAEKVLPLAGAENIGHQKAYIVNISDMFSSDEEITESALRTKANQYINAHQSLGVPKVSITASFISLWQTEEYKNIAPLERVQLCDTVTVKFVKLGISAKAKVIKTVYDTIAERYKSIELGEARSNFASTVLKQNEAIADLARVVRKGFSQATEQMKKAIADATALITGNAGGYVVLHPAEHPQEILIMDTPDIETAVHVWRWNSAGLGYSSTGYNGTYGLAMTMNGAIVADFITTGTLDGGLLRADSVQANAISAGFKQSITDAITSAKSTVEQEFAVADEQLRSSITSSYTDAISASEGRTQTLIQQTADNIMLQVYTKTETGNLINGAIDDANDYTDTQLGGYYTKSETDAAITASADGLTLSFNTKLGNDYYTKTQTDSQISVSKSGILQTVSNAQSKYDTSSDTVNLYGYGAPSAAGYAAADYSGKYYLNQKNGYLYLSNGSSWSYVKTLKLITTNLQSQITQNANNISLKVSSGDVVSEINQSADTISLTAGRLVITTGNFQLTSAGAVTANSGTIGGWKISSEEIYQQQTNGYTISLANFSGTSAKSRFLYCKQTGTSGDDIFSIYRNGQVNVWKSELRIGQDTSNQLRCQAGHIDFYYNNSKSGRLGQTADGKIAVESTSLYVENSIYCSSFYGLGGASSTINCYSDIKFSNGKGLICNSKNAFRYATTSDGVSRNGLWVGAAGTNLILTGSSIAATTTFYVDGHIEFLDFSAWTAKDGMYRDSSNTAINVGNTSDSLYLKGSTIYANNSPISTSSDARKKRDIVGLDGRYLTLIKSINPVSFKYIEELSDSNRTHTGFIAQDVLTAMNNAGISTKEFAAFVDLKGDGEEYALRYEEFISPLLLYVKHLESRIELLERTG